MFAGDAVLFGAAVGVGLGSAADWLVSGVFCFFCGGSVTLVGAGAGVDWLVVGAAWVAEAWFAAGAVAA